MNLRTPSASGRPRPVRAGQRLLVAALATALVASTAACADEGDPPGDDAVAAQEDRALEPAVEVDPGPAPTVELLDEGSGELRVMAYSPSRDAVT
ncbi:hypothetical protein G6019_12325, partial [Dietzia sp. DQ12-76]|nr:hypothetical protein [Dietzia sp. DQ12-76]